MIDFHNINIPEPILFSKKKRFYDDNIFTFDIETISLFKIDGEYRPYLNSLPQTFYRDTDKACVPYIWQFGVNDTVYYGREFNDFERVLKLMSDTRVTRFIYVHNLSYEMQFLLDIIESNNWHITDMCARNVRKPIQFTIKELNITFRCSYMLTNLSLEKSAEKYTNVKKAVNDLDYNRCHSPLSVMNKRELYYCEMDCITLYHIINDYFMNEYGHVANIPLTQTGEVRRALLKEVDFCYLRKQWQLVPPEHIYMALVQAFMGGITHSNILYTNKLIKRGKNGCKVGIWSYDFSSSYPYVLTCFKYPSEPFFLIREKDIERYKDNHCLLYQVRLDDVKSKLFNHYIPYSKVHNVNEGSEGDYKLTIDNGRVTQVKSCEMIITDLDLQNIIDSYYVDVTYINIWASYSKYLDRRVIKFILDRYSTKTTLKGVEGQEDFYMKMKQQLNSVFGMSCTNQVKSGIDFNTDLDTWETHQLYDMVDDGNGGKIRFIDKKLNEMRKSYSTLFFYSIGVWCTAYARSNLWRAVRALDTDVIYYDTDSIKGIGERVKEYVEGYNKEVIERLKQSSIDNDLPLELYIPRDKKGIEYPLGVFDNETKKGLYKEFITLGAKKYAYKDSNNKLHITVAGVSKKAVVGLRSLKDFNKQLVFYPECTGKLTHYYTDNQPDISYTDCDGNRYTCKQHHAIILQPTSYSMSITPIYERLINEYYNILPGDMG